MKSNSFIVKNFRGSTASLATAVRAKVVTLLITLGLLTLSATPLYAYTVTYMLYMQMIHVQAGPIGPIQISPQGEIVAEGDVWAIPGYNLAAYGLGASFQPFMDGIAGSTIQIEEGGLDQNIVVRLIIKNLVVTGGGETPLQLIGIANPQNLAKREFWMFADLQVWSEGGQQLNAGGDDYDFVGDAKMVMSYLIDDDFAAMLRQFRLNYQQLAMAYWVPGEGGWAHAGIEHEMVDDGEHLWFRVSVQHLSEVGGAGDNGFDNNLDVPSEYETIQAAIDVAEPGDTVLVAPGTYYENLVIGKNLTLGSLTLTTGDNAYVGQTILDGQHQAPVVSIGNSTTKLAGFTIRNGLGVNGYNGSYGGGIYGQNSDFTLENLVIIDNYANSGGGVSAVTSTLTMRNCVVANNEACWGGGVNLHHSPATFENVTIVHNRIDQNNGFSQMGGGLFLGMSPAILRNTIIYNNEDAEVAAWPGVATSSIEVAYSDIEGGADGIQTNGWCDVTWGEGSIDADPLFLDPDNGDYSLTRLSPCVDTGDPNAELDPDGTRSDMGAYYFHQTFHQIALHQGWNILSSVNQPRVAAARSVWSEVVARGSLLLTKDQSGRFYVPDDNFSNMLPWDVRQGYWAKLTEEDTLVILNLPEETTRPIPLRQGWNIVSYFPEADLAAPDAFANVVDYLVMAKDELGQFYRPSIDYSNMGSLTRGRGYQALASQAVELVYNIQQQGQMAGAPTMPEIALERFIVSRTDHNMSVLINAECGMQNAEWAEIGAFTKEGLCVGAASFRNLKSEIRIGMAIWGDDASTDAIDGAVEGEPLTFRVWDGAIESSADVKFIEGDDRFVTDGFAQVAITGLASQPTEWSLAEPYPNPFNPSTTIKFSLLEETQVRLTVYDLAGREAAALVNGELKAGRHTVTWNAEGLTSGVYLVKMETPQFSATKKVTLLK